MLKAENIDVILDGKAVKGLRGLTMEAADYMFFPEVTLYYHDDYSIDPIKTHTILEGVETQKKNLLSKKEETVSFLTFICKSIVNK